MTVTKIDNPYLAELEAAWAQSDGSLSLPGHSPWIDTLSRREMCMRYAWAVPNHAAIMRLVHEPAIVEVGAGTGYWAHLIAQNGGDIVAYDAAPPGSGKMAANGVPDWHAGSEPWFPVQHGDAESVKNHSGRTLFLCWPPYSSSFGADVVRNYHAVGGQRVIFVGENQGGCTGDDEMFAMLGERGWCGACDGDFEDACSCTTEPQLFCEVGSVAIPQWWGLHDGMTVYDRVGS